LARVAIKGVFISNHVAFLAATNLLFSSLRDGLFNDILSYGLLALLFALHFGAGALLRASERRATGVA
jgi:hypothetical protein